MLRVPESSAPWLPPSTSVYFPSLLLSSSGINYDKPLPPIQVASLRAERIAKEKKVWAPGTLGRAGLGAWGTWGEGPSPRLLSSLPLQALADQQKAQQPPVAQPPPPPPQPQPPPPQQPPPPLPQPQAAGAQQPPGPPAVQPQPQAQPQAQPAQPPPKVPPAITTVGSAAVLVRRRLSPETCLLRGVRADAVTASSEEPEGPALPWRARAFAGTPSASPCPQGLRGQGTGASEALP